MDLRLKVGHDGFDLTAEQDDTGALILTRDEATDLHVRLGTILGRFSGAAGPMVEQKAQTLTLDTTTHLDGPDWPTIPIEVLQAITLDWRLHADYLADRIMEARPPKAGE